MESRCSIQVQVLSFCGTDGRIQPIRFRLEDEAHQLQTVAVRQVVSASEVQYAGVEALVFLCRGEFGGRERLFELRYAIRTHRWVLLRVIC